MGVGDSQLQPSDESIIVIWYFKTQVIFDNTPKNTKHLYDALFVLWKKCIHQCNHKELNIIRVRNTET